MSLPEYVIRVNGGYFMGQTDTPVSVKHPRHTGWSGLSPSERLPIVYSLDRKDAATVIGNRNLRSTLTLILDDLEQSNIGTGEIVITESSATEKPVEPESDMIKRLRKVAEVAHKKQVSAEYLAARRDEVIGMKDRLIASLQKRIATLEAENAALRRERDQMDDERLSWKTEAESRGEAVAAMQEGQV